MVTLPRMRRCQGSGCRRPLVARPPLSLSSWRWTRWPGLPDTELGPHHEPYLGRYAWGEGGGSPAVIPLGTHGLNIFYMVSGKEPMLCTWTDLGAVSRNSLGLPSLNLHICEMGIYPSPAWVFLRTPGHGIFNDDIGGPSHTVAVTYFPHCPLSDVHL